MSVIPQSLEPSHNIEWKDLLDILQEASNSAHSTQLKEMVYWVTSLTQEAKDKHDLNIVHTTLKELRRAFQLFGPFRDVRKVCIFGSARTPETDPNYQMAQDFAHKITQKGFMVITGAGPGIMEAGNRGSESDMSFGVNIRLPFEQEPNPYIAHSTKLISFKYFFNRKLTFMRESDATILFPGGFGTHDEGFELLTLLQTGRCAPRPLLLLADETSTYWKSWQQFIEKELLNHGYISSEDMSLFLAPRTVDDCVSCILEFYRVYHSIRYIQDSAIIRLNQTVSHTYLSTTMATFSDLLLDGHYTLYSPGEYAQDTEDFYDKYRLVFKFDKMRYSRLFQLIMALNRS